MAKKEKPEKKALPQFDVDIFLPSFRVLENARILDMNATFTEVSYRRKSSGNRDIAKFYNKQIVTIIGEPGADSTLIVLEPRMRLSDVSRNYKIKGSVDETDAFFLEVTNQENGTISFVNPELALVVRPDEEANKNVPKRGRKPGSGKKINQEAKADSKSDIVDRDRLKKKKRNKDRHRDKDSSEQRKKVKTDW